MPAFMYREMHVIEQRQLAPVQGQVQKQQSIEDGPAEELRSGDWLPINFGKMHSGQWISHPGARRALLWGDVRASAADEGSVFKSRFSTIRGCSSENATFRDPTGSVQK